MAQEEIPQLAIKTAQPLPATGQVVVALHHIQQQMARVAMAAFHMQKRHTKSSAQVLQEGAGEVEPIFPKNQ